MRRLLREVGPGRGGSRSLVNGEREHGWEVPVGAGARVRPTFGGDGPHQEWRLKGATLSHNTAEKEYGLNWEVIVEAIEAGKLQYRRGAMHGNPFLRLLRREVEDLVCERGGGEEIRERRRTTRLGELDREIRAHRKKLASLEAEQAELLEGDAEVNR